MMVLASGVNFGFVKTLPHLVGISCGHALMIILVGLGVTELFKLYPIITTILKAVAFTFMLWFAWKIANAKTLNKNTKAKPLNFWQAAAFQWVNPKAWAMALAATTIYGDTTNPLSMIPVAIIFALCNFPSTSVWAILGEKMSAWLGANTKRLIIFNRSMAILLVVSLAPFLF